MTSRGYSGWVGDKQGGWELSTSLLILYTVSHTDHSAHKHHNPIHRPPSPSRIMHPTCSAPLRHHHSPTLPASPHAPLIPARIALAWRRHPDCILCAAGAGCSQKGCLLAKTSLRRFAACAGVGTAHTASMEPQVMLKAVRDKVAKVVKHIG